MFRPLARGASAAALLLAFAACSRPVESTAPRAVTPEPPDPALAARESEYREQLDAGQKAIGAKNPAAAITHFERAAVAKPKGFEAHLHLARVYAAKDDSEKAIKAYGAATTANPRLGDAYLECAALLERAGRLEDACQEYAQLIREELDPKLTAKGYWLRGALADRLGNRSDYRYDREQALKLDPDYRAGVTAGDVVVVNRTEKEFKLTIDRLVNPDGTERTFPPGFRFMIPDSSSVYLTDNGRHVSARSLRFTITFGEKSRSYTASYAEGMSLEVRIFPQQVPDARAANGRLAPAICLWPQSRRLEQWRPGL